MSRVRSPYPAPIHSDRRHLFGKRRDFFFRQRPGKCVGRTMRVDGQDFAVIVQRLRSISGFFAGLRQQTQNEWVLLIALLQFRNRRLVVAEVERDITAEIGIETHLVGIVALVQYRFGCGQVLLRFFASSWLSDTDTRQRALPSELPQVLLGRAHVGLAQRSEVPALVPLKSVCLLYTSPSPRDGLLYRMPS